MLPLNGKNVLVLGGGKFGTNALRYMKQNHSRVLVVDTNPECLASREVDVLVDGFVGVFGSLHDGESGLLVADAIEALGEMLNSTVPDLVFTAVPGNVVARLVVYRLTKLGFEVKPFTRGISGALKNIPQSLVSFVDQSAGVIVASYMLPEGRCRENCIPPRSVCAVTGRPKLAPMNRVLEFGVYGVVDVVLVLVSLQLTGGLGAVEGKELKSCLEKLETSGSGYSLAVGTACDCHGVINLFEVTKRGC
jgi:hypothetical protein